MEWWKRIRTGVMEKNKDWSDGVLVLKSQRVYAKKYLTQFLGFCHLVFPLLQHSNTPAFQYSITPVLQGTINLLL